MVFCFLRDCISQFCVVCACVGILAWNIDEKPWQSLNQCFGKNKLIAAICFLAWLGLPANSLAPVRLHASTHHCCDVVAAIERTNGHPMDYVPFPWGDS